MGFNCIKMIISEKQDKKEHNEGKIENVSEYNDMYSKVKKEDVVKEAKYFHDTKVDPSKCNEILAKIIYLANHVCLHLNL
jgi:hypothetical protein